MVDAVRRNGDGNRLFDHGQEWLPEPNEMFQKTALAWQVTRFLSHREKFQDSVLQDFFKDRMIEDGGSDARLSAWTTLSPHEVRQQLLYLVARARPGMNRRELEKTTDRYLANLRAATFHVLENRACAIARRDMETTAEQMRAIAADEVGLGKFREAFIAVNGAACFAETFALDASDADPGKFREALLHSADALDRAAASLAGDHFLHHLDVFRSMPEITRSLGAHLPPGSFIRESFVRGLRTHFSERRLEETIATGLKLVSSIGAAAVTSGVGLLGRVVLTSATTLTGAVDMMNTFRKHTATMRWGILSGGMTPSDWQAAGQRRSDDFLRDFVSLAGNLVGAIPGRTATATSIGVQTGTAASKVVH